MSSSELVRAAKALASKNLLGDKESAIGLALDILVRMTREEIIEALNKNGINVDVVLNSPLLSQESW